MTQYYRNGQQNRNRNTGQIVLYEPMQDWQPDIFFLVSAHLKSNEWIDMTVRRCTANLNSLWTEQKDSVLPPEVAAASVIRICLNAALSENREHLSFLNKQLSPAETSVSYSSMDEVPAHEPSCSRQQAMTALIPLIQSLPEEERLVFVMHYLDGFSFAKISEMTHLSRQLLEKRAQLAKQHLSQVSGDSIPELFGLIHHALSGSLFQHSVSDGPLSQSGAPEEPGSMKERIASRMPSIRWKTLLIPAAAVLAVGLGGFFFRPRHTIRIPAAIQVSFTGVNGAGTAEITFADTGNEKLRQVLNPEACTLTDSSGNPVTNGTLKNGTVLEYRCAFEESLLKKNRIQVAEDSAAITVEGLNDPAPINLFEDVLLYGNKDEESGAVYLYAEPRDTKFREVYYNVVSKDENGILVYADISDELLLQYGLVAEDHYHTYPQSVLPEDVQPLVREEILREQIGETAASRDEYGREVANGSNADINALAQSFLGRTGACNEIANQFIYALYGVTVHTGYSLDNLYRVDAPEAGDLIYYYDTAGNYRHVATYIGNGLVLNGNYGDGHAHITSMYESWYANNPMTFFRVSR